MSRARARLLRCDVRQTRGLRPQGAQLSGRVRDWMVLQVAVAQDQVALFLTC